MGAVNHEDIEIWHKLKAITEMHHSHDDQMMAIAKWINAEFDYNPRKLRKTSIEHGSKQQ